jgi:hypothetical protein
MQALWKASRTGRAALKQRVQPPGERRRDFGEALTQPAKKSLLALRQEIFRPPAPFVAVLAQGLMVLPEVGEQRLQFLKLGLDNAQAREKRGVGPLLGRCHCVRHEGIMARKGYRSAKFDDPNGLADSRLGSAEVLKVQDPDRPAVCLDETLQAIGR